LLSRDGTHLEPIGTLAAPDAKRVWDAPSARRNGLQAFGLRKGGLISTPIVLGKPAIS